MPTKKTDRSVALATNGYIVNQPVTSRSTLPFRAQVQQVQTIKTRVTQPVIRARVTVIDNN